MKVGGLAHATAKSAFAFAFASAVASARALTCAAAVALSCFLASPARAAPPDARLALKLKVPRIEKLPDGFTFVLVDAPDVLDAELLSTGELLLDPKSPGEAHVFLFSRRLVRVLELAVERPLLAPEPAPRGPCEKPRIDRACHAAWARRLQHLAASDAPALLFEIEGLQEEAKAARELLVSAGMSKLDVSFSPFGVRIKGAKDEVERRRALMIIWPVVLGPLRVDD